MAARSTTLGAADFQSQADALFRKNLAIHRRACRGNCYLILFPVLVCGMVGGLQTFMDSLFRNLGGVKPDCKGCDGGGVMRLSEDAVGGLSCSQSCPLPVAQRWPVVLLLPGGKGDAALNFSALMETDNKPPPCVSPESCTPPAKFLVTGANKSFAQSLTGNMFPPHASPNLTADISGLADYALAIDGTGFGTKTYEAAFDIAALYFLQSKCTPKSTLSFPVQHGPKMDNKEARCSQALFEWRENSIVINNELYKGFRESKATERIENTNDIVSAYDLTSSDLKHYNMIVQYNSEKSNMLRVARLMNLASNAYLQLRGNGTKMRFGFVKDMPRDGHPLKAPDMSFIVGKLVFIQIIMLLFPVILSSLVYEKQQKLRAMMKMHGLGDMAYWTISYCYFLLISLLYIFLLVTFGATVGIKLFAVNSYMLQFLVYFIYMNLQISFAFFTTTYFSTTTIANVAGHLYVTGSGFIGEYLFRPFVEDTSVPRSLITLMEFFPPISLYRIIYELSPPPSEGFFSDFSGVHLGDLSNPKNGILVLLIIMVLEWPIFIFLTLYLDEFGCLRNGIRKLLTASRPDGSYQTLQKPSTQPQEFEASIEIDRTDILREREIVDRFLKQPDTSYSVIIDNIRKVYPPKDGNAEVVAVKGFSLSIQRGQCFGLLGSNGAGKTSLISMLTGFTKPTSGTAYIDGMDIRTDMSEIYTRIGVCPQFNLLWETLTGREHLMFYGRLKRLNGAALFEAAEQSLKALQIFEGGVADTLVSQYSGGMKRRLSVAISLIGDPKVVYLDEPSTGLDPASRSALWNALKFAKKDKAIILTTHSMEEAEALCDRIGIAAYGRLRCTGTSKECFQKRPPGFQCQ
ncbi:ABC transporter A family member 8 isoform X2 [Sorghum bicolor]|uniref:ABC transporter A family member 8 isoform X2 n=1 Tax=Sorghum bicolor TaxID=4558 RepID=UPI000B424DF3|nr:ABC transporter A family member 8 isoform X2 [Sorghum bicolor]|eukprot:XP_021314989.1 ABC transporter A family member 8 isoform X2 [Sorghum bicolor]